MKRSYLYSAIIALAVSLTTLGISSLFEEPQESITIEHINRLPSAQTSLVPGSKNLLSSLDFTETAEKVVNSVVHIKSTQLFGNTDAPPNYRNDPNPFRDFFGDRFDDFFGERFRFNIPDSREKYPQSRVGSGSGVIMSDDGYIITNHHVIANADDIEVTLHDNRTYKAMVIGTDPSTDLALIKIKEKGLQKISFVDSDQVKLGEWVLAVGNPFSLNSTVTAGIVSAKGRNINILKEQYAVENFIQTDAAINPGNSGGALVNLDGGLVGINTAIASPTGIYSGYGFAVPSNIVSKVMEDLLTYGIVQRGVLGIMIRTVDGNLAKLKDLNLVRGVYVDSLMEISAAKEAGIKVGDVIISVNGEVVNTSPELQGKIAQYRPGESITLVVDRRGKEKEIDVVLMNKDGNTAIKEKDINDVALILGAEFEDIDKSLAKKLDIHGGVKIVKLSPGKLKKFTQVREGFIITKVDGKKVHSKRELFKLIESKQGGVMIEGIYENYPGEFYYAFGL